MTPKPKLFIAPNHDRREPLPYMPSHQEWCRWLKQHNTLSWQHRACLESDRCEALTRHFATEIEWAKRRSSLST